MKPARAVLAGVLIAALACDQDSRPDPVRDKRHVDPFEEAEALSLSPLPSEQQVAVVTSCGAVYVYDETGALKRTILTGAAGWKREVAGSLAGRQIPTTLRGIPVATHAGNVLAVTPDGKLLAFGAKSPRAMLCTDPRLVGATLLRSPGIEGPIVVGTASGSVLAIADAYSPAGAKVTAVPEPLAESVLAMAVDPKGRFFLSAGEGPLWHVHDLATLALTKTAGNHIGEEFIHAMEISPDARLLGVSHGYSSSRVKTFDLTSEGIVGGLGGGWKGNGGQEALAFDSTGKLLLTGDVTGAVRVFASEPGDAPGLPRSTRLPDEVRGSGMILAELGSWRVDATPICSVRFLAKDSLVVSLNQSGVIVARSWPGGEIRWTATVPDLCPSGGAVRVNPRTFNFGKVARGSAPTRDVLIEKTGSADLKILGVETTPPGSFTSKLEEAQSGSLFRLTLGVAPGIASGYVRGTATIKTNVEGAEALAVYFYALIVD